ncbi:hypothetical protein NMP99_04085 [Glutamicibacter mishrai]|uniref:hypothetical protein n=1 Tax=Glutamicibacter mishrai TaxID=1775880 RepID=UPI0020CF0047|nr:hypothetical protein [Glutamicibacter mishrai]UTT40481.1 hypothetical protein NMP99_04085 [Glutamicibacter mishrai]
MMQESDRAYFAHLQSTEVDLNRWRIRAQRIEPPERGSELQLDDAGFAEHPISEMARTSLISAGEHLRLAWTAIKVGQLYPIAHFTTLRSALLAASQAVYILGPEDSEVRRGRGLAAVAESYKRSRQFHKDTLKYPGLTETGRQEIDTQIVWLTERLDQVRQAGAENSLNITDKVIPYASKLVYGRDETLELEVNLLWRKLSGDAHSLTWSMAQRTVFLPAKAGQNLSEGASRGSLEEVAQPFEASYRILKRGWSLYDQRCESPE